MGDTKSFGPTNALAAKHTPLPADPDALPSLTPGTLVGERYRIEALVAQGGMGAIYAAQDERLARKVAIKVMLQSATQISGFSQRFEREAKAASRLNHPGIVVVHDFGQDEHGHFLVLEWVDGKSLGALVAETGPLPPPRASELVAQVCDALAAAHAAGIIHRDVKPDNVMVLPGADGRERAKLVDFGIARVQDSSEPQLTQVGFSIGSPYYMSPEQALAETLDARSDVYSAGATLFFALTGRRPYLGDRLSIVQQLIKSPPPELPPALARTPVAAVVRKSMAKVREERHQNAAELGQELRQAISSQGKRPSLPALPALPSLPRMPSISRRTAVGAGGVAAGLALLGLLAALLGHRGARFPELEAMLQAGRAADARAEVERRLKEHPQDAALLLWRGHALAALEEEPAAREAYQAALRADPDLAEDARMLANAVEWLERPSPESTLKFWRESVGKAGLSALREASDSSERNVRWNAIHLRQDLHDRREPDVVAASIKDLGPGADCGILRGAAERLMEAKDKRALEPLQQARKGLNFIDRICAGPVVDEAIRALGGDPKAEP